MGIAWSQLFPPSPGYTEKDLPSQQDKVFLITGGTSGVGFELATILYTAGAHVCVTCRSSSSGDAALEKIRQKVPDATGRLFLLHLDLADLSSIKPAVGHFHAQANRLDGLFLNAAVSLPPAGSVSAQGHELMMATNVLGHHLLTQLLLPHLRSTALSHASPSVRVVWTTSQNAELGAPTGGFTMAQIKSPGRDQVFNYNASKIGNMLLSAELARAEPSLVSVVQNPGNLKTNLLRHMPAWQRWMVQPLLHPARLGALTELYAGLSPELNEQSGGYVIPWGRCHPAVRQDFLEATKSEEDGGNGLAREFRKWCDDAIERFL